ncbi:MAG: hypothetical protein COC01_04260 [Bacteroidetes bacterium]|nr:MAG: hypothetical protein COC01_04260 [Bacteroidota bacterium]
MEKSIKHLATTLLTICLVLLMGNIGIAQNNQPDPDPDDNLDIVHNDKTGIVIDVLKSTNYLKIVLVQDTESGDNLVSLPTQLTVTQGNQVLYNELSNKCKYDKRGYGSKGKGNGHSHGKKKGKDKYRLCEIKSVQ